MKAPFGMFGPRLGERGLSPDKRQVFFIERHGTFGEVRACSWSLSAVSGTRGLPESKSGKKNPAPQEGNKVQDD